MPELVKLETYNTRVEASVVEKLEEWLAMAQDGTLHGVAIAGINHEGCIVCGWSMTVDRGLLLGAIARVEHGIHRQMDEVTIRG